MAELQDAREQQTRAAAIAERGRIAGELHDVLAHSLSGAAIQQGARKLAKREHAGGGTRAAIDRASELEVLVDSFRANMNVDATLTIEGRARALPTVKTHVNRIFYKTGARDRAQAVRYAYEHGLA